MAFLQDGNHTAVTEFILLGLTDDPVLKVVLFSIILCIYLVTVSGNLSTILLIRVSSQLHHPMYFFLSHLASVDIGISSSVTPNMLVNFLVERSTISYLGCGIQLSSAALFGTLECFLLAVMAYDRFMAICNPLLYSTKMSSQVCIQLVAGSYVGGFLNASFVTHFFFSFLFCGPNRVNHFFCDIPPLLALSCSSIYTNEIILFMLAAFNVAFTLLVILSSYLLIFVAILKMRSAESRKKTISTCASHLTTVSIFYGTIIFMYLQPSSTHSMDTDKITSVFYTMIIPMLNPLVYSLRNKEVKSAFTKVLQVAK